MRYLVFLLLMPFTGATQNVQFNISELDFMAGTWVVDHQWGKMEETWSRSMGDNMMCTYRCVKDGKIVFYEFIVIEQSDSVPVLKLRHFNPGSLGWEEKQSPNLYPLISLQKNRAVFERPDKKSRIIYERKSPSELLSVLEREDKEGNWKRDEFHYSLPKP